LIALPRASELSGFIATLERKGIDAQASLSPMGQAAAPLWATMEEIMKLYLIERKNRDGLRERITAHSPCKGWRVIKVWWEPVVGYD
jgi:hypothetical protein